VTKAEVKPSEIYFFKGYDVNNETFTMVWNAAKNCGEMSEFATHGNFSVLILLHVYAAGGMPFHGEWWVMATTLQPDASGLIYELVLRLDYENLYIIKAYTSSFDFNLVSADDGAMLIKEFISQDPYQYWVGFRNECNYVKGPFIIYFCTPMDFGITIVLNLNTGKFMIAATAVWMGNGNLLLPMEGDLDHDGTISIIDITIIAMAFGSEKGGSRWNEKADIDCSGAINIVDIFIVARNFQKAPSTFVMKVTPQQVGTKIFTSRVTEIEILTANAPRYNLPLDLGKILNFDLVKSYFNLSNKAVELLEENGFVVVQWSQPWHGNINQFNLFYDHLYYSDVPIFVTADSMLHTYHIFFDEILRSIEEKYFMQNLTQLGKDLTTECLNLYDSIPPTNHLLKEASLRNICFFSVAAKLLNPDFQVPEIARKIVDEELSLIEAHDGFHNSPLFKYEEDYSQYIPRGHYSRNDQLKRYFKAMIWFGRMRFMIKTVELDPELAKIQTVQAALTVYVLRRTPIMKTVWEKIYTTTCFFVGFSDDLTIYDYEKAINDVYGEEFEIMDLENPDRLGKLQDMLMEINNAKIIYSPIFPWQKEELIGLRFMGQRFIPDSYIFQELVFDKVGSRLLPKGLDVMAVLGSQRAEQHLSLDKEMYPNYEEQLAKLQSEFSNLTVANWTQNLYWSWLYCIQSSLHKPSAGHPTFMKTDAWLDEKVNTALGSWTELRHDTILYAKQSYTVLGISFPLPGYIEPIPQLYSRLIGLCNMTINGLKSLNLLEDIHEQKLLEFCELLNTLIDISIKELKSETLSEDEVRFIKDIEYHLSSVLEAFTKDVQESTLVADVHTDPNTKRVLEEGCGYIDVIVVVYKTPDGRLIATAGPVFSYYEFTMPLDQRLTDEAWKKMLETGNAPQRPDWTSSFHE
jgi:hypothetical protein